MTRSKQHIKWLPAALTEYAKLRTLDFAQYSEYHMRIMDGGYVTVDFWTTGRYYILMTDYHLLSDKPIVERQGEKGSVPTKQSKLTKFLDGIFYATEEI